MAAPPSSSIVNHQRASSSSRTTDHAAAMEQVLLPHAAAMATPVLNPPLMQNHRLLSLPRSHRNNSHGNCHTIHRDHLLREHLQPSFAYQQRPQTSATFA